VTLRGAGRGVVRSLLAMTTAEIDAVRCPAQRLVVALSAVHAARGAAIRALLLDDVDLSGRTITLADMNSSSATSPGPPC
jgi:hypothetical protein